MRNMKQIGFLLVLPVILVLSCGSDPKPVEQAPVEPSPPPVVAAPPPQPVQSPPPQTVPPPQPEVFTPQNVSQERYETTKTDVQTLIEDLNKIIRARNYNTWLTYLGEDYRKRVTSREFLNDLVQDYPAFKGRINYARDYFNYVVVPSHSNDHVDDISFETENRVKAYTVDNKGQRLVLYDLELIDDKWKIIN